MHRNLPPSVQQCQTEITQWSRKFKKGSSSPLALMEGILVRSYLFYLSFVPYLDQEEINLRKKFPYSYSIRLVFHMPGSYHLTIFIYYLGLWSRHLKSYPLSVKNLGEKKLTSNKGIVLWNWSFLPVYLLSKTMTREFAWWVYKQHDEFTNTFVAISRRGLKTFPVDKWNINTWSCRIFF